MTDLIEQASEFNRDSDVLSCTIIDLLSNHVLKGGRIHVDILTDDDTGVTYPHMYAMHPTIKNGTIVEWWCDGCGYIEAGGSKPHGNRTQNHFEDG